MSATNSLHYKLCCEGAKWLRKQDYASYKIVVVELICIGAENPDVWGTNGFNSIFSMTLKTKANPAKANSVITSRADFLKDRKKFVRQTQGSKYACGNMRYFLVPEGLVSPDEVPASWGLLEWKDDAISIIKQAQNIPCENHGELAILCSIMRREGLKNKIYNYRKNG